MVHGFSFDLCTVFVYLLLLVGVYWLRKGVFEIFLIFPVTFLIS
jgi:hypothetical protein